MGVGRAAWIALLAMCACGPGPAAHAQESAASGAAPVAGGAPSISEPESARGRRTYRRFCVVCHGNQGEGGAGPPLKGISARLTAEQIRIQIVEPRGSMPRLYPSPVDSAALDDLGTYLAQLN
jgi:mono/diheme cytochrome c family protein